MTITEHPLRALRKTRGLTQEEVAQAAGISRPTVVKIEQGAHITHTDGLRAIAHALSVPWQSLCGQGQAVVARSREELAEITGDQGATCLCGKDPVAPLAARLDLSDPENRKFVDGLREFVAAAGTER